MTIHEFTSLEQLRETFSEIREDILKTTRAQGEKIITETQESLKIEEIKERAWQLAADAFTKYTENAAQYSLRNSPGQTQLWAEAEEVKFYPLFKELTRQMSAIYQKIHPAQS